MKVGIITGSIREGRKNPLIAEWVKNLAEKEYGTEVEVIDILQYELPLYAEAVPAAYAGKPDRKAVHEPFRKKLEEVDAFIFITPEYNHGLPSALKNALDYVYHEWNDKAAGIVSYGGSGGVRAAEQLRIVLSSLKVAHVRTNPALSIFTDFRGEEFMPAAIQEETLKTMLTELSAWGTALNGVRKKAVTVS